MNRNANVFIVDRHKVIRVAPAVPDSAAGRGTCPGDDNATCRLFCGRDMSVAIQHDLDTLLREPIEGRRGIPEPRRAPFAAPEKLVMRGHDSRGAARRGSKLLFDPQTLMAPPETARQDRVAIREPNKEEPIYRERRIERRTDILAIASIRIDQSFERGKERLIVIPGYREDWFGDSIEKLARCPVLVMPRPQRKVTRNHDGIRIQPVNILEYHFAKMRDETRSEMKVREMYERFHV